MAGKSVPNAWDDDWESQADKAEIAEAETQASDEQLTRAQRLAKHEEENRKLWKSADEAQEFHFLAVNNTSGGSGSSTVASASPSPLSATAPGFRPAMKVLSRKPAPTVIKRRDPVSGMEKLTIRDDAAEAEEEDAAAKAAQNQLTLEQIRERQQREYEERQRKYDEARAKIFGETKPPKAPNKSGAMSSTSSGGPGGGGRTSTPASSTSSRQASPVTGGFSTPPSGGGGNNRGRGRGRGSHRGDNRQHRHQNSQNNYNSPSNHNREASYSNQYNPYSQQNVAAPAQTPPTRELYDPNYSSRPTPSYHGRRNGVDVASLPSRSTTPRDDDYIIRTPRGPDGSGRGGFGFTRRGG